ncbi:MAG TPA: crossover junction endodeoxyribonuclease RuvC [Planctomycetota bacterium]|nr:crossover junction endodeoxyribonuclease RuvC [Planctomycetota bacterium]
MASPGCTRVLGIDPGTRCLGFALLERRKGGLRLIETGVLRPDPREPYARRLAKIHADLCALVQRLAPDCAALEAGFVGINASTALKTGEGRGVALAALAACGLEVHEFAPATVKRASTGQGQAGKTQVARMVALQLGLSHPPQPTDATDAYAVALCYFTRQRVDLSS